MHRLCHFLIVALSFITFLTGCHGMAQQSSKAPLRVQVCQNKDCCQRFQGKAQNLVQTLRHLVPAGGEPNQRVEVESSSCLSQCGKGPNICVNVNGEERYYGSVVDAASAGAVLEMATSNDIVIHPTLVAAVNVMERAAKAPSLDEKERLLTSVIRALQKKQEQCLQESFAMAHAHAMRAQVRLERCEYDEAISDAQFAANLDPTHDKAWRVLANAQEKGGNIQGAIATLGHWSKLHPAFATKNNKEMQRLKELVYNE